MRRVWALQVDDAKAFIKHRVLEKVEAKEIPHQVSRNINI